MDVRLPDGTVIRGVPDGISKADLTAKLARNGYDVSKLAPPEEHGVLANAGMGFLRGAKDVIDTGAQLLASGFDKITGTQEGQRVKSMNDAGQADFKREYGDSTAASIGRIGGNVVATLPVGGIVGKAVSMVPGLAPLGEAVATGGFRTGLAPATTAGRLGNLAIRSAGGAINGGASAALVNPDDAGTGAIIGGVLPPALVTAGKVGTYIAKGAGSVVKPFTEAGQAEIAGNVIRQFADGGPTALDVRQLVPGSMPTLAEATGNAGLATLQRGTRDLRPNAFVERESQNADARAALFDKTAGDKSAMEAADKARQDAADALYGQAFQSDAMRRDLAASAEAARAPFAGVGVAKTSEDLATPGLRELAQRPDFKRAVEQAKTLAANKGIALKDPLQSLQGLHFVKLALDDMANPQAASSMGRNASAAINDMRSKLADELSKVSPQYGAARATYADMSQPVNAMEALQGLKLTDAQGKITLAKVQNALRSLQQQIDAPGPNPAKSITQQQMQALTAIRDDLMRQANLGLGRSIGSNTFQNLSTDNILNSVAGNTLTRLAGKVGIPGLVGQVGRLAYSGPNEAIRNRLVDMMLDPQLAQQALAPQAIAAPNRLSLLLSSPAVQQPLFRAAPLLANDR